MSFKSRLTRLERIANRQGGRRTFWQLMEDLATLHAWKEECGYADCLAILEAGETGPAGLEEMVRSYAQSDRMHRAFARVEVALQQGRLPDDADVATLTAGRKEQPAA